MKSGAGIFAVTPGHHRQDLRLGEMPMPSFHSSFPLKSHPSSSHEPRSATSR